VRELAYFDNAATTFPKPECVYQAMDKFYRQNGGNAGRGQYALAANAGLLIADTRKRLGALFHALSKQVIFTPTATIALNMILQGVIKTGVRTVYLTPFEHNAVTRTLHHFENQGIVTVKYLAVSDKLEYDLERIKYQFDKEKPDLIVMSHASNVIGLIAPVKEICCRAKNYGAVTVVDMAQTAGLIDLDLGLEAFDFAVFAGHKTLLGPTGLSGFLMKPDFPLPPVLFGGTGYDSANQNMPDSLPERYEMGTVNISGMAGLNASLQWIKETTIEAIHAKENVNRRELLRLLERYEFINIIGNVLGRDYAGIVSCQIDGISSDGAGRILEERGIAVRTGLQCAPLAHRFLGTYPAGTIRFSVNYFTSENDFAELKVALDDIEDKI
jgi:cysteine desulfurase family protein